jgi:hypothetical protein
MQGVGDGLLQTMSALGSILLNPLSITYNVGSLLRSIKQSAYSFSGFLVNLREVLAELHSFLKDYVTHIENVTLQKFHSV